MSRHALRGFALVACATLALSCDRSNAARAATPRALVPASHVTLVGGSVSERVAVEQAAPVCHYYITSTCDTCTPARSEIIADPAP